MKIFEIFLICASTILTVVAAYKWGKLSLLRKISFITVIITAVVVAINSFNNSKKEDLIERVNAKFGDIDTNGSIKSTFMIGYKENGTTITRNGDVFGYQLSKKPNDVEPLLKVTLKKDKILLNVVIRDFNGDVIAVIDNNTWTIFDDNYEYNDDNHSFEMITKGTRHVYFQVFYKEGIIYLSGYLISSIGKGLVLYCYEGKSAMYLHVNKNDVNFPTPDKLKIPKLFKYPREKYYGEKL